MLTSKQRAFLRAQANALPVAFQIGKGEIDDALIQAVRNCLGARELAKFKVLENSPYTAAEAAAVLCEAIGCESVQIIGGKLVLFWQKKKDSRFNLKDLCLL